MAIKHLSDWPKEPKGNYQKNPEGGNANENMRGVWIESKKIDERNRANELRAKDREKQRKIDEQKIKDAAKRKLKKEIITKRYYA